LNLVEDGALAFLASAAVGNDRPIRKPTLPFNFATAADVPGKSVDA